MMLLSMATLIRNHKELLGQLIKRDVVGRYKGSYLGLLWTFINPIVMLAVYTFVFSEIFNARWGTVGNDKMEYALVLFTGFIVFNIFSEVISRSPNLILSNANYVTKVVFPLEILPISVLGSSLIHASINLVILLVSLMIVLGVLQWTLFLLPLVLLPLLLITLGIGWFMASLGVYLRDLSQIIGIAVQAIMLLSPIFYPVSAVPQNLKIVYYLNPISYVVEDTRRVVIWGQMPQWTWLGVGTLVGAIIFYLGYKWFQKTKPGFADVI